MGQEWVRVSKSYCPTRTADDRVGELELPRAVMKLSWGHQGPPGASLQTAPYESGSLEPPALSQSDLVGKARDSQFC